MSINEIKIINKNYYILSILLLLFKKIIEKKKINKI